MNTQVNSIITSLKETLDGDPWYGKSVYAILNGIDPSVTNVRTAGHPHTALDLIYHLLTWSEFTLARINAEKIDDMQKFESLDWREIDPQIHGWEEAVQQFRETNSSIIRELESRPDTWLKEKVDYRDYDFNTLLTGIIQHHIYHAAQINYIDKALTTG